MNWPYKLHLSDQGMILYCTTLDHNGVPELQLGTLKIIDRLIHVIILTSVCHVQITISWTETNIHLYKLNIPLLVQFKYPLVRVPPHSSPFVSTHQHCPVDAWHCFSLKEPSVLHWGTKRPMGGSFSASSFFFWHSVNSEQKNRLHVGHY